MAYQQPHRDPYYNTGVAPDLPPAPSYNQGYNDYVVPDPHPQPPQHHQPQQQQYGQHEYDAHSNWDAKSYQSSYAGSQAHLNPQYDAMTQVNVPPVPQMPYQQNYPPAQQRLGVYPQHTGYSDAREKFLKRRSVRQVELQQGNLVLDMPVPSHIIPKGIETKEEMTTLRYTAATCDPDEFMRSKYTLRPYLYGRKTELFIVMTMYNEDEVLFTRTMNAYVPKRYSI